MTLIPHSLFDEETNSESGPSPGLELQCIRLTSNPAMSMQLQVWFYLALRSYLVYILRHLKRPLF